MDPVPQTKVEVLRRIDESWSELERTISPLSDEQLAESGPPDGWSVKDHLAHLAAYARGIAALLRRESRWDAMQLDKQFIRQDRTLEEVNAVLYQQASGLTVAKARAGLEDAHRQVKQAINRLEDDDLFKPYADYQPDDPGVGETDPIIEWVIGDTYEHYAEHTTWIGELIALRKWNG